jgi:hypothetical protein
MKGVQAMNDAAEALFNAIRQEVERVVSTPTKQ